ncbi:MAG TPA: isocitrate lyase, partial [Porticoccaceae bacterium]|nr:isocitrate lyase [Porticoccaceae bacterium]
MTKYDDDIAQMTELMSKKSGAWSAISAKYAARMRAQNQFKTGLDIAKYTASIMRRDMQDYDA